MSILKQKTIEDKASTTTSSFVKQETKPIIASARTGLSGADSALMRRLPSNYVGKTIRDVLGYIVDSEIADSEKDTAKSLRNELGAAGSVIVINGKKAKLTDRVDKYLVDKTRPVGDKEIQYQELEIEVSAIQQGGYYF